MKYLLVFAILLSSCSISKTKVKDYNPSERLAKRRYYAEVIRHKPRQFPKPTTLKYIKKEYFC